MAVDNLVAERRSRKLLVFDVEGTLFRPTIKLPTTKIASTIWPAIAQHLGPDAVKAEIATHTRWHAGNYSGYLEWMSATVDIHRRFGLTKDSFDSIVAAAQYQPGVSETLAAIDRSVFEIVLVTGGFKELATRPQIDFGISHVFAACEYLFNSRGTIAACNLLPCDFEGKVDFVHLMLRAHGLQADDWIFVGDGINDIPIAKAAPFSVAYDAPKELREVSAVSISDFRELLPILQPDVNHFKQGGSK